MVIDENTNNVLNKKIDVRVKLLIWLNLIGVLIAIVLGLVLKYDLLKMDQTSIYNGLIIFGRCFSFFIFAGSVLSGIYVDGRVIKIKKCMFFSIFIFACLTLWLNFSADLRIPDSLKSKANSNIVDVNQEN